MILAAATDALWVLIPISLGALCAKAAADKFDVGEDKPAQFSKDAAKKDVAESKKDEKPAKANG